MCQALAATATDTPLLCAQKYRDTYRCTEKHTDVSTEKYRDTYRCTYREIQTRIQLYREIQRNIDVQRNTEEHTDKE